MRHRKKLSFSLALLSNLSFAQITGTITGVVEDPSGARVAGAPVMAVNQETNVRYPAITTEAGVYVIPQLPLGDYTVTVEAKGFKTYKRSDVPLGADARLRVDVRLELGGAQETVTVSAAPPLVESERATLGGSFTPEIFDRLPIGRDPMAVLQLVPGSQPSQGGFATGVFNGAHEETTDYKVDGAPATMTSNYRAPQPPIEEMVEEVVLQSGNYSAEYGRGSSQLSINTRAGANGFHGTLFEYFQNEDLNANGFFNNLLGNGRAINRQNLFGLTVGGPLLLPKLYNGRNRTFFNFGYQGTRSRNNSQFVSTVPSAAMRAGDFSGPTTIYDPATTTSRGASFTRDPFPGNRIPASRFDPVAVNILANSYPQPNRAGTANNYAATGPSPLSNTSFNARLDQNFSDRNRLTARYSRWYQTVFNFDRWPGPSGAPTNNNVQNNDRQSTIISAEHTYVVRADMVNTVRFGYFVQRENLFGPGTDENWAARLGLKNAGPEKFPLVSIAGLTGFGGGNLSRARPGLNYQASDTLLLVRGLHSLKLGFEFRELQDESYIPGNSSGSFTFNTLPTQNPAMQRFGVGFASFLLGIPSSSALSVSSGDALLIQFPYYAAFAQDDFRASKRLTLNLGMRWELSMPYTEKNNRMSAFNLATGKLDLAGRDGYPTTLFDPFYKGFQPRIGFAFSPSGGNRMVIRGGYGIFFLASTPVGGGLPFTAGPWAQNLSFPSPDNGITFPLTLAGGFPAVDLNAPLILGPSIGVNTVARRYTPGYMQQWSLNAQRQMGTHTLVMIGYVGNKGNHLPSDRQLNQVPARLLGPGNAQARRPYPNVGAIRDGAGSTPIGNSIYHALQVQMQRRLQHGVWAQAAYTFSKTIDDFLGNGSFGSFASTSVQDNYNLRAERSVAVFDQPHLLSWAFVWELPFGKGRGWLNRGGIVNALLGGWNLSSLSNLQSGMPLVMGTFQNQTGALSGGSRPNRLAKGKFSGARGIDKWFDPGAFVLPAPFTFGGDSRTEPQLRAPGALNMSAMLQKEFRFTEKRWFEFRAQSGNVLNHFNPGGPNTTIGGPGVGTITGGNGGRGLTLALKLHY